MHNSLLPLFHILNELFHLTEEVILNEERTTDEEKLKIIEARRRATARKMKQMKQSSHDTDEVDPDEEDLFADIGGTAITRRLQPEDLFAKLGGTVLML